MQFRGYTESFPDHPRTLPHGRTDRQSHFRTPRHGAVRRPAARRARGGAAVLGAAGRVAHAAAHRADRAGKGRPAGTAAVARLRVRAFTVDEIGDAVDVRGVLEGMAARLLAERGAPPEVLAQLEQAVEEGRQLLAPARLDPNTTVDARAWGQINRRFHEILCEAAGNRALLSALEHNNKTPLAGPAALTLPSTPHCWKRLRAARPGRSRRPAARHHPARGGARREPDARARLPQPREQARAAGISFAARWPRGRCWRTPALEMSARLASRLSYADR